MYIAKYYPCQARWLIGLIVFQVHCSYTEVCHECGRAFKHQDHLKAHMKVHSMARPFECQYCGKGFRSKNNMQMHVRSHLNLREYSCEMCGVAYVTPSALRYVSVLLTPYALLRCQHLF